MPSDHAGRGEPTKGCNRQDAALFAAKTLYLLIGPKGAGKTHVGKLIEQHAAILFLRVERIWLSLQEGEDGWLRVAMEIDRSFERCDRVMIENLGAGEGFERFHQDMKSKYSIKMIRVFADLGTCLDRVLNRSADDHIPVSDDKVMTYNRIAAQVQFDWDLEIDNNGPASEDEIFALIKRISIERKC